MTRKTNPSQMPFNQEIEMGFFIIIVAGGSGTRMQNPVPKQFIELLGKPILMHTIEKFNAAIPGINCIVVIANPLRDGWERLCTKHRFAIPNQIAIGGETRFHSVRNGLALVPDNCIVGIHDAARPLVSEQTIINSFKTAEKKGNACPTIAINESLREVNGEDNRAIDRSKYFIIQTPQCFQSTLIKKAFQQEYNPMFTDEASVLESMGGKINLIEGNPENIKITTQKDLIIAEALMKSTPNVNF